MKNTYCGAAALALVACAASSSAWADTLAPEMAQADLSQPAAGELAPPSGDMDRSFGLGTDPAPLAIGGASAAWNLAQVAGSAVEAGQPVVLPEPSAQAAATTSAEVVGPPEAEAAPMLTNSSNHVPSEYATHRGFFKQAGSIKTELILMAAYVGVQSVPKFFKDTTSFHFTNEGWFGKDTHDVGMDKLTHAFNTYLIAEILHSRLHKSTGASEGDALTAGILAAGLMAINEMSDAIEPDSGYSMQDVAMNVAGATFSVLRNTVPGLKEKLAFKIEIMPNDQIYSRTGKKHYEQQRFMLSLKGTGFKELDNNPLRYLDLQVGYYASDFLNSDRDRGIEPKQHLFVGVGLNLGELLFGKSQSWFGKAARSGLDYFQFPYTSVRVDTHGDMSY